MIVGTACRACSNWKGLCTFGTSTVCVVAPSLVMILSHTGKHCQLELLIPHLDGTRHLFRPRAQVLQN